MQQLNSTPRLRRALAAAALAVLAASALNLAGATPSRASGFDSASAETQLLRDINADRAANGRGPLVTNAALSDIARGGLHSVCGGQPAHGRSQDMVERGYFSHQVPPCGEMVWPALAARGIQFSFAGENIGWNNVAPQAASVDQVNSQFMSSPEHRANVLGNFNQVGVGAFAAPGAWGYNGRTGAVVYTEIFVLAPLPAHWSAPPAWTPPAADVAVAPPPPPAPPALAVPAPPPPPTRPFNGLNVTSRNGCVQARDLARDGALWCAWQGAADSAWTPWVSPGHDPVAAAPGVVPAPASPWAVLWSVLSGTTVLTD